MKLHLIQLREGLVCLAFSVLLFSTMVDGAQANSLGGKTDQPVLTPQEKQILANFESRVKDYLKQRQRVIPERLSGDLHLALVATVRREGA